MQISAFELLQTVAVKPRELCACVGLQTGVALQELSPPRLSKGNLCKRSYRIHTFPWFWFYWCCFVFCSSKIDGVHAEAFRLVGWVPHFWALDLVGLEGEE